MKPSATAAPTGSTGLPRPERRFMARAIREARKNFVRPDGGPFGACIVKLVPGFMRAECLELFESWLVLPGKALY